MSGKLVGQVYERQLGHAEQDVLIAMADHADDFGANCYPSVPYIAWKTGYHERQVQRVIARLRDCGVLILVRESTRYRPTEYHVNLDALPMKPPFKGAAAGVTFDDGRGDICAPGVTFEAPRGDIAMSPEPSYRTEDKDIPASVPTAPTPRAARQARPAKPAPPTPPAPLTFTAAVLAHLEATVSGASLKRKGGTYVDGVGNLLGILGRLTKDDAAAACELWTAYVEAAGDYLPSPHNWPAKFGAWAKKNAPAPSTPIDSRLPIGRVAKERGFTVSNPAKWPADVLATYADVAAQWGHVPSVEVAR